MAREADILDYRAGEQEVVLLDAAHLGMQGRTGHFEQVVSIDENSAFGRQVEFLQQAHDRGFAASGVADQGNRLSWFDVKGNIVQDGAAGFVMETDVTEFDAAADRRQRLCLGIVSPLWFKVHEPEVTLGARHSGERLVILVADYLHGLEKKVRQEEKHH